MIKLEENLNSLNLKSNPHYVKRYISFIKSRKGLKIKGETELHHILPKAKDFFPQFKNIKENQWNGIHLTFREHIIAHWILSKAFPNSSQTLAFYNMTNEHKFKITKEYEKAKQFHIEKLIKSTKDPIRNAKISKALTGRPKTQSHKDNLKGPRPEWHGQKIREGMKNTSWKHDVQRVAKHRDMMIERNKNSPVTYSMEEKYQMKLKKMTFRLSTPFGTFSTYSDLATHLNVDENIIRHIFRSGNLTLKPKKPSIEKLGITHIKGNTWKDYGFDKIT